MNSSSLTTASPGGLAQAKFNAVVQPRDHVHSTLPETLLILFAALLFGATLYLVFQFWMKRTRQRRIPVHKLESYRYSRLNQTELDVDNSLVYCRSEDEPSELEEESHSNPATLHVETDSLINISNCTMTTNDRGGSEVDLLGPLSQNGSSTTKLLTLEEASDEDLLQ